VVMKVNVPSSEAGESPLTKPLKVALKGGFGPPMALLALFALIVSGALSTTIAKVRVFSPNVVLISIVAVYVPAAVSVPDN
jgi:hypothetical protein